MAYRFLIEIDEDGENYAVRPHEDNPSGPLSEAAEGELFCATEDIAKALWRGYCDWAELERGADGVWRRTDQQAA